MAAIINQEISNDKISIYHVSTEKENVIVFNLIKNRMETYVKVIYTDEMVPSKKNNLKYYYSIEGIKCNYSYQDNIILYSNETYVCSGFGIKSAIYNQKNNNVTVEYNFEYYDTNDQSKYSNEKINDAIKNNVSNLKTDYQKALWAYQWVLDNLFYDEALKNISVYSGLTDKGTVCIGYATLYSAVANKLGLNCRFVEGIVRNDKYALHAWNTIKLDGKWYYIDPTWGDNDGTNKYFLKSKNTFKSVEYGIHESNAYENYIDAGEIFADTDYVNTNETNTNPILPSVYNVKMDILKNNILTKNETYIFMLSNSDNIPISFKSDDTNIATVNEDGIVVGVNKGTTTITAFNTDLNIAQSCKITVK
jgi:hypothetical protein